jgi:hypothetical protein
MSVFQHFRKKRFGLLFGQWIAAFWFRHQSLKKGDFTTFHIVVALSRDDCRSIASVLSAAKAFPLLVHAAIAELKLIVWVWRSNCPPRTVPTSFEGEVRPFI